MFFYMTPKSRLAPLIQCKPHAKCLEIPNVQLCPLFQLLSSASQPLLDFSTWLAQIQLAVQFGLALNLQIHSSSTLTSQMLELQVCTIMPNRKVFFLKLYLSRYKFCLIFLFFFLEGKVENCANKIRNMPNLLSIVLRTRYQETSQSGANGYE